MKSAFLVVGAGGLLGSAICASLVRGDSRTDVAVVPWDDERAAVDALVEAGAHLLTSTTPWRVVWCAGAGVVGTSQEQLDSELRILDAFLDRFALLLEERDRPDGALFLASSAGGVYAGSTGSPFSEDTVPVAISPYGVAKLTAEGYATSFAERTGVPVLIGRIANLYGPGQSADKAQGLITALCRAHVDRRPASIYVSLDTARDYLFVDDAAAMILACLSRVARARTDGAVVKILGSRRATTVAMILGELHRISKRAPLVVLGTSPLAQFQTRDLRFASRVWPDLDDLATTSLPAGIFATLENVGALARRPRRTAA